MNMFTKIRGDDLMNKQMLDILQALCLKPFKSQRELVKMSKHSLGVVNRSLKQLAQDGYIDHKVALSDKAKALITDKRPQRAIILAAGYGMRMVPINKNNPKGLIEINHETLIERLIKQLHEVNIHEIYIVVGYMKECFEYLIDDYDVKLIVNEEYSSKNNLHSLNLVHQYIDHAYIIPSDLWCRQNPFSLYEFYSWYMISNEIDDDSTVRMNRKDELVSARYGSGGHKMIGISYLVGEEAHHVQKRIQELALLHQCDEYFWEASLYDNHRMIVHAKQVDQEDVIEINTYEQLRDLDEHSSQLKSDAIDIASSALHVTASNIRDIMVLKKGMTNRSFLFHCNDKKYIMRIPGEGTNYLINRKQEYDVYQTIKNQHLCDRLIYINPENGYKITEYFNNARVCDPFCEADVKACMKRLKQFHDLKLTVDHEFDIFKQLEYYETLWNGVPSIYRDYKKVKQAMYELKTYIDQQDKDYVLTHIDAVADNFLFVHENEQEAIYLIDWEYAGMQDPHLDIAMFAIYAQYDKTQVDTLIDFYFDGTCSSEIRAKIYAYIAISGLLWSNWCEYKRNLGVEFGAYSLAQYRYAKDYYKYAKAYIDKE